MVAPGLRGWMLAGWATVTFGEVKGFNFPGKPSLSFRLLLAEKHNQTTNVFTPEAQSAQRTHRDFLETAEAAAQLCDSRGCCQAGRAVRCGSPARRAARARSSGGGEARCSAVNFGRLESREATANHKGHKDNKERTKAGLAISAAAPSEPAPGVVWLRDGSCLGYAEFDNFGRRNELSHRGAEA